ncbi:unnamed protein product [Rotaria socialis]|uniref:Store-operated calcium entry-associated regulatory factor n=1 Tax=Rotaria socialis TaxID=392032 RepID=A0A818KXH7_9BILA|nr:unnamed protein product [Rotaria socialis]CAF4710602.1 unnamed protein product [Rotaria socialis]
MKILALLAITCYLSLHCVQGGNQQKSVLLESVQALTLYKGQRTQARRVSAVPQLKCVGGSAKGAFEPDVVQCYNRGSNGVDIQWECTSEMPKKYKFGRLSVSCEGYEYPDDPYILAGSCGLEYNLELTDKSFSDPNQSNVPQPSNSRFWPFVFKVALIVLVFFAIKSFLAGDNRTGGTRPMSAGPDHRPPGGGGGGWFSNFFPGGTGGFGNFFGGAPGRGNARPGQPPPAGFRTDFTDYGNTGPDCNANRQQNTGGTGFLTGAALGALGGYVFGARNRRPDTQNIPRTTNTGWFGGGGGGTTNNSTNGSSSPSSGTHTSSGFGGTTRR